MPVTPGLGGLLPFSGLHGQGTYMHKHTHTQREGGREGETPSTLTGALQRG